MNSFKYYYDLDDINTEFSCCRQEIVDALNKFCINFRRSLLCIFVV